MIYSLTIVAVEVLIVDAPTMLFTVRLSQRAIFPKLLTCKFLRTFLYISHLNNYISHCIASPHCPECLPSHSPRSLLPKPRRSLPEGSPIEPSSKRIKSSAPDESAEATLKYKSKKDETVELAFNRIRRRQHLTGAPFQYTSKRSKLSLPEEHAENIVKLKAEKGELTEQARSHIKIRQHADKTASKSKARKDQTTEPTLQRTAETAEQAFTASRAESR